MATTQDNIACVVMRKEIISRLLLADKYKTSCTTSTRVTILGQQVSQIGSVTKGVIIIRSYQQQRQRKHYANWKEERINGSFSVIYLYADNTKREHFVGGDRGGVQEFAKGANSNRNP